MLGQAIWFPMFQQSWAGRSVLDQFYSVKIFPINDICIIMLGLLRKTWIILLPASDFFFASSSRIGFFYHFHD